MINGKDNLSISNNVINSTKRIALITGASRGIGYYTALELAKSGAHVIACSRDVKQLDKLKNDINKIKKVVDLIAFDLRDTKSIDLTKTYIEQRWGKLDILIANAGILGPISPIWRIKKKSFEEILNVNIMTTWNLMRTFDPLLKKSKSSRAIILSSGAAHKCRPLWGGYSTSKAAIEALSRTWAKETSNTSLKVINVDPGPTRTAMRAQAMPSEDPNTIKHPQEVAKSILYLCDLKQITTGKLFSVQKNSFVECFNSE
ncbi:SDR family NAD(P)-dependent oxidoreductase [Candidatus Liberibacter americanus]|uniref:Dehydrogenase n=1 Tax=Candidatus Liberibacter americanus str. Sao Paulo TaxID=1261131 RepID=U6B490_9HYPH|nr:SDR family oxidoreductase [Candidatus Liberibacter americanus]AHA27710.1 Dehydrogenase [Candidatus Liberibacter americanus str. Sao Paulo]EMS36417.1 oxidoreductase protein [Candidatus Liberibacter americanus PW_SP]